MKRLVLSGINLFAGGTLEIYKTFVKELGKHGYDQKYDIIAFVHRKAYFEGIKCRIKYIEIPDGRNYLRRLYYEEKHFYEWSKGKNIDVWIAMHDLSPNVVAKKRYTYYHTPHIFYEMPFYKVKLDPICFLKSKLYKYFVARHLEETTGIIVQANWMKEEFSKMFKNCNIIVARPDEDALTVHLQNEANDNERADIREKGDYRSDDEKKFFYPSFPRVFKNFEVICEACRIMNEKGYHYKVLITMKGDENRYARWLYGMYGNIENINWLGILERDEVEKLYKESDVLIFSSTLETWGLPITEWGKYNKPMILADLPYAHETAEDENKKIFFNADNGRELANIMSRMINEQEILYSNAVHQADKKKDEWGVLLSTLLNEQ